MTPAGRYQPELLMLAPDDPTDEFCLSLVAHFLEFGVALELDEQWRLPQVPPRELSAYRACLFPDTARDRYDAELDAYFRAGGFLGYFKYYPTTRPAAFGGCHHFVHSYGRDAYCYHLANVMLEGGLTLDHAAFRQALAERPGREIMADLRHDFFRRFGRRDLTEWTNWGDPAYTMLLGQDAAANATGDADWADLVNWCLQSMVASKARPQQPSAQEVQVPDAVDSNVALFADLLMEQGTRRGDRAMAAAGQELGDHWYRHAFVKNGLIRSRYMQLLWGESFAPVPCLYWLGRLGGDPAPTRHADALIVRLTAELLREDCIWHHWSNEQGRHGAAWSRGTYWPILFMTRALLAVEPGGESWTRLAKTLRLAYGGLARYQDPRLGIWRVVIDEPETRLETSATVGIVYCHDRLREQGVLDDRHEPLIARAVTGLKQLYYDGGLAASCRGTSTGVPEYYRTRPIGYFRNGLLPGALAARC